MLFPVIEDAQWKQVVYSAVLQNKPMWTIFCPKQPPDCVCTRYNLQGRKGVGRGGRRLGKVRQVCIVRGGPGVVAMSGAV